MCRQAVHSQGREARFPLPFSHVSNTQSTTDISPQLKTVYMAPISGNLSHLEDRCKLSFQTPSMISGHGSFPGLLHPTCSSLSAGYTTASQTV